MSLIIYGLLNGCLYGLWSVSFSLIYRPTRVFHVVHAAVFTIAAYAMWVAAPRVGLLFAFIFALAFGSAVGVASEYVFYRPLRKWGTSPVLLFVASLAVYIVFENIIQLVWGAEPRTLTIPALEQLDRLVTIFGAGVSLLEIAEDGLALLLWLGSLALLRWTLIGKAIRAIAVSPDMADLAGINVQMIRLITFAIGSFLISVAGLMALVKVGIEPAAGLPVWVIAVIATLVSGAGPVGSFVVGLAIGLTESFMLLWLSSKWQPIVPILILLVYLAGLVLRTAYINWTARRLAHRNVTHVGIHP